MSRLKLLFVGWMVLGLLVPMVSAQADPVLDALTDGEILRAIWLYLGETVGYNVGMGLIAFGIFIPSYILTSRIEFTAGLWILVGLAFEQYIPGEVLNLGYGLMVLGMAVLFWKIFFGGSQ